MTVITNLEACTVRVPLPAPLAFSTRGVTSRDYTLVRVRSDEGVQGIGFNYSGSSGGSMVSLAARDVFAPIVLGEDPFRVEGLWQEMYQESLLHGRVGSATRAMSAIDIALWDHNARLVGLPLWKLLGGYHRETVPAYASGGYYFPGKTPEKLADEVRGYVDLGFKAVKIKIGRLDSAGEEERVRAVRQEVGPDVLVMLDANNAWKDLATALRYTRRLEQYDPYFVEEPFSPDDIDNHARLARATTIPVATGEVEAGRWRHKELLDKEAAVILQTDAAVAGGITEWRRIAATAASYGVPLAPHWFHDLHVHLVGSTPNAHFVEYFHDSSVLNFRDLIDRQLEIKDGGLVLPTGPGLGFNFDEEAVERFRITSWQAEPLSRLESASASAY
ncbi:mandelate racemase/muconate lactonizing enzyme family protein [Cellulosimicrobium funkei]|nr:mandelate racemase/muconate lactonizing enzyme family protein [Cellulosimicrobium funkei]